MRGIFKSLRTGGRYFLGIGAAVKYRKKIRVETDVPVVLKITPDGKTPCVACKICEKLCPAQALQVKAVRVQNQWRLKSFELNYARCSGCRLCTEACPVEALEVDANAVKASSAAGQMRFVFVPSVNDNSAQEA